MFKKKNRTSYLQLVALDYLGCFGQLLVAGKYVHWVGCLEEVLRPARERGLVVSRYAEVDSRHIGNERRRLVVLHFTRRPGEISGGVAKVCSLKETVKHGLL